MAESSDTPIFTVLSPSACVSLLTVDCLCKSLFDLKCILRFSEKVMSGKRLWDCHKCEKNFTKAFSFSFPSMSISDLVDFGSRMSFRTNISFFTFCEIVCEFLRSLLSILCSNVHCLPSPLSISLSSSGFFIEIIFQKKMNNFILSETSRWRMGLFSVLLVFPPQHQTK